MRCGVQNHGVPTSPHSPGFSSLHLAVAAALLPKLSTSQLTDSQVFEECLFYCCHGVSEGSGNSLDTNYFLNFYYAPGMIPGANGFPSLPSGPTPCFAGMPPPCKSQETGFCLFRIFPTTVHHFRRKITSPIVTPTPGIFLLSPFQHLVQLYPGTDLLKYK